VRSTLDWKSELAADSGELEQTHLAEFGASHAEIAESEGETVIGTELGQEPGELRVGGEELDDWFEVECVVTFVHRGALSTAVREELLGECPGYECH